MTILLPELRRIAAYRLRREYRRAHTLQPTALVHEAYLRLVDAAEVSWQDRTHFLAIASRVMRRVLVEHARKRRSPKRGGGLQRAALGEAFGVPERQEVDLITLEDALRELGSRDAVQGEVVEMRFFGGLSIEEIAAVLGISPATVKRKWQMARAWLRRELR